MNAGMKVVAQAIVCKQESIQKIANATLDLCKHGTQPLKSKTYTSTHGKRIRGFGCMNLRGWNVMREIKFRGKRVDNGGGVYGLPGTHLGKTYILELNNFEEDRVYEQYPHKEMWSYEVTPETVGQFTGLKDRNGKEIYEGDIVRTADGNVVATIKIGECYPEPVKKFCEFHGIKNHKVYCLHAYDKVGEYLIEDNKSLEIIGNIYGNPDLREE